jgi:hypothetical protein
MAGMIVMGLAMGVHEGVKKIQDKKEERKANKAALVRYLARLHTQQIFLVSAFHETKMNIANGGAPFCAWAVVSYGECSRTLVAQRPKRTTKE